MGAVGNYIKQIHSFSQFHPRAQTKPKKSKETGIASQEWKAFDFEVGDGLKDLASEQQL